MASIPDNKKSRGRPSTGIGRPVGLRLYPDLEAALDKFLAKQPEPRSRPEAIRSILTDWLRSKGYLPKGRG